MINIPQRQQPIGLILEMSQVAYKIVKAFLPLILLLFFKESNDKVFKLYIFFGILAVLIFIIALLKFINFKFYIDTEKEEFILQSGIISKSKLIVSIDKIIEVNLEQKYIHLLLGTYKVKLDTAGSESVEVVIHSLSKANALAIKEYITNNKQNTESKSIQEVDVLDQNLEESNNNPETITEQTYQTIKLSFLSLLKVSFISNYGKTFGLMLLFLHFFFEHLKEFNQHILTKYIDNDVIVNQISNSITFFVLTSILLFILLNLVLGLVRYFDYKIVKNKESLLITFGLLQRFQTIVKPKRIQYFAETTSVLRRYFDVYRLDLALIGDPSIKKNKNTIEVPALSKTELQLFKSYLDFKVLDSEVFLSLKPNIRFWIVNSFIGLLILAAVMLYIFGTFFRIEDTELDYTEVNWLVLTYIFLSILLIVSFYINYKRYKVKLYKDRLVIKSGILFTKFTTLPLKNIQSVRVSYAFWQKNNNLAYLKLQTASGKISLPIANKAEYQKIANYVLYDIEAHNTQWM